MSEVKRMSAEARRIIQDLRRGSRLRADGVMEHPNGSVTLPSNGMKAGVTQLVIAGMLVKVDELGWGEVPAQFVMTAAGHQAFYLDMTKPEARHHTYDE